MTDASRLGKRPTGFHAREGYWFRRSDDGDVIITTPGGQVALDAGTWASVVCSVSATGETGERWRQACAFHGSPLRAVCREGGGLCETDDERNAREFGPPLDISAHPQEGALCWKCSASVEGNRP